MSAGRQKHALLKKAKKRYMIIGGVDANNVTLKTTHVYDFDGDHAWTTGNLFLLLYDFPIIVIP